MICQTTVESSLVLIIMKLFFIEIYVNIFHILFVFTQALLIGRNHPVLISRLHFCAGSIGQTGSQYCIPLVNQWRNYS